jgi:hypothetical protein
MLFKVLPLVMQVDAFVTCRYTNFSGPVIMSRFCHPPNRRESLSLRISVYILSTSLMLILQTPVSIGHSTSSPGDHVDTVYQTQLMSTNLGI